MKRAIYIVAVPLFIIALFVTVPGFAGWNRYAWPIFRGDRELTGVAQGSLSDKIRLRWTFETDDSIVSSPVVDRNTVYIGSTDGKVYALRIKDGKKVWELDTETAVEAPPLILDGVIYVGSLDGKFYAINSRDGTVRWIYETGFRIAGSANWISSATGKGSWILIGSYDNVLHCVDTLTGKRVWTYETDNYINGAPAISLSKEDQAVFGGCDGHLHVVSLEKGISSARIPAGSYIAASAAIYKGFAYLGHYGFRFISVDLEKQSIAWEYGDDEGGAFFSSPAVNEKYVIVGARDWKVHCIDRENGGGIWTFDTGGEVDSSPVICGDKVVFGSADGFMYLLDLENGKKLWSYEIGEGIVASPAVANGVVIIGAYDGRVYGFGK
jgi:outer membrane protein assembly factor BamB